MSAESEKQYRIDLAFARICDAQRLLDTLMDDAHGLRDDYGYVTAERAIERAQDQLVAYRDNFEKVVMKVKPTAKLDRQYEKDLS
jgi:hypothetical protein